MNFRFWKNYVEENIEGSYNDSYINMYKAVLERGGEDVCGIDGGIEVLSMIERAEYDN